MDRRIKKTRKILSDAFLHLLKQRDFHDISIRDITDHADVAYSTFFRNFESKEDLLLSYLQQFIVDSKEAFKRHPVASVHEKFLLIATLLFEAVYECPNIYPVLSATPEAQSATKQFKHELIQLSLDMMKHAQLHFKDDLPPDLIIENAMNQLMGLLNWWLDHHMTQSIKEMVVYYETIVLTPMWSLLEVERSSEGY